MKEVTLTLTEGFKENWYRVYLDGKQEKCVLYYTNDSVETKEKAKQEALEAFEEVKWSIANPSITKILLKEII
jgi:hypothetical protein